MVQLNITKEQLKLLEKSVKPESDAMEEFWTSEFQHTWKLDELDSKKKSTMNHLKKLKQTELSYETILKLIDTMKDKFWNKINEQWWWIEEEEMEEELKRLNKPNHPEFQWTKNIIDQLIKEETKKSKKLKTFEHSYRKSIARGDPIDELDDNVKQKIAKYLRASLKKKKRKKSTKKPKKKKKTKKKPKKLSYKKTVGKSFRCKVVGYHKNGIKIELPNKKVKNLRRGIWSPYEKVYPLNTILPITNINDKYPEVAGWYKPEILKKYPNKSALEIQKILEEKN